MNSSIQQFIQKYIMNHKKWILVGTTISLLTTLYFTINYFYVNAELIHAVSEPDVKSFLTWEYDATSDITCIVSERNKFLDAGYCITNKYLFTTGEDLWMYYKPSTVWKKKAIPSYQTTKYIHKSYQIYDLRTKELVREYTLEEIEDRLPEEYILVYPCEEFYREKDGEPYIFLYVCHRNQVETRNSNYAIPGLYLEINVLNDTICLVDESSFISRKSVLEDYRRELDVFWSWGISEGYPLVIANGFSGEKEILTEQDKKNKVLECYYGTSYVQLKVTGNGLPKNNSKLYGMFPNLKQYIGNEDVTVNLLLSGAPSAEKIMKLVLEEGQEVSFEGCIMGAEYSKDGQEHEIRSFEDYYEWRKADE